MTDGSNGTVMEMIYEDQNSIYVPMGQFSVRHDAIG